MTDEQFDEICRNSLAFDPGRASGSTWAKIRPPKKSWLPTIPEILGCGCACGLTLFLLGTRFDREHVANAETNPVIEQAVEGSLADLQASALEVPDTSAWTKESLSIPDTSGTFLRKIR